MMKKIVTVSVIVVGSSSSGGGSCSKVMRFVAWALERAKAACSYYTYASTLSNTHHRHLSAISKKFAATSMKVNRGSSGKPKQQPQQQALSLLLDSFLPVAASGGDSYEAVLNGGLLLRILRARCLIVLCVVLQRLRL